MEKKIIAKMLDYNDLTCSICFDIFEKVSMQVKFVWILFGINKYPYKLFVIVSYKSVVQGANHRQRFNLIFFLGRRGWSLNLSLKNKK